MTQRIALVLSAGITAFLLAFVIALAAQLGGTGNGATSNSGGSTPTPVPQATGLQSASLDPGLQSVIDAREAIYRQQLQQANQRLQQANVQLQQAYSQLQILAVQTPTPPGQPAPASPSPSPVTYPVSPEQAVAIAQNLAPGASLARQPDLVDFQGKVAYEVSLDNGSVYIDANSSRVLYSGTTPPAISAAPATSSAGRPDNEEHDDGEDD